MFIIMDTDETFSFEKNAAMDALNLKSAGAEQLMWKSQLSMPWPKPGEKWVLVKEIFKPVKL